MIKKIQIRKEDIVNKNEQMIQMKEIINYKEKTYGLKMKVKDRMIATEFYNKVKIFISQELIQYQI